MTKINPLHHLIAASCCAFVPYDSVLAHRDCDVILCSTPHYVGRWLQGTVPPCDYPAECAPPPAAGLVSHLVIWTDPPTPAFVNCEPLGGSYLCEAWPQGSDLTYEWNIDGGVAPPYMIDPSNPFLTLNCYGGIPGSVAVTVVSPYGIGSTATRMLPACGM